MTKPSLLFNSLKVLCNDHCLIGAKNDLEILTSMKRSTVDKIYADSEGNGIHSRYMYSILDAREITGPNQEKCQLIRIKDPWANSLEWKGACSDFDKEFWSAKMRSAFNARNVVDEAAIENDESGF